MNLKCYKKSILTTSMIIGMFLIGNTNLVQAQDETKPSLYERLGGVYNIAAVVDNFIDRLFENEILNANPGIDGARNPARAAGLKFQVTALVCQVTGGPEQYTGKSMLETHKHMKITEEEWQAMATDFKKTLLKFKVPDQEQNELFTIVGTTKPDIVLEN